MVADDVWSPAMAQALAVAAGESRLLVTTRRPEVAAAVGGADLPRRRPVGLGCSRVPDRGGG